MKIGILTQPLKTNYGGLLQNYALQQVLIRAGHTPITIDQGDKCFPKWYILLSQIKWNILHIISPSRYPKPVISNEIPSEEELTYILQNCLYFIDKYISHTPKCRMPKDFRKYSKKYDIDAFVVGSDQCWRPIYNVFLPEMFLSFVKDKHMKRIAYAASFGTDKWEMTPEMTEICSSLAQKFGLVTVREDTGVELCRKCLKVEATKVLDPTMLLTKEDYIHLIEAENEQQSKGTLFTYILDPTPTKDNLINRIADNIDLTQFTVLPKYQSEIRSMDDIHHNIEDCVYPHVTTWLRAFIDAKMVIVDSFHGMVFSIIFNKPFWVIGNAKRGMSRFTSLLKLFSLENRLLDVDKLGNVDWNCPIDWNKVNSILDAERIKSTELLINALK